MGVTDTSKIHGCRSVKEGDLTSTQLIRTQEGMMLSHLETNDSRTNQEKRRDQQLAAREADLIRRAATKSYRERVIEYNKYLTSLSDYHDIQKVSGGTRKW